LVAVLVFSFILIPQKSEGGIYAPNPPPALIPETPGPPPPWRTYAWIPGHWRWHRNRYDWVPGVYAFDEGARYIMALGFFGQGPMIAAHSFLTR
jgi:hypothetical protein